MGSRAAPFKDSHPTPVRSHPAAARRPARTQATGPCPPWPALTLQPGRNPRPPSLRRPLSQPRVSRPGMRPGPAHREVGPPTRRDWPSFAAPGVHWLSRLPVPRLCPALAPAHSCGATWPRAPSFCPTPGSVAHAWARGAGRAGFADPPGPPGPPSPRGALGLGTCGQGPRAYLSPSFPTPSPSPKLPPFPFAGWPCLQGRSWLLWRSAASDPPSLEGLEKQRFLTFPRHFLKLTFY